MALLRWILSRRDEKLVALHVETLLTRTTAQIREAALDRAEELPRSQARGYVRAKATAILWETIEQAAYQPAAPLPARLQATVLQSAAERVSSAILEQTALRRRSAQAPRRRAA